MKKDGIKVEGHIGKWYVIDETEWKGETVYLLEHETWGDEAASVIINEKGELIMEDVWNGFDDLEYLDDEEYYEVSAGDLAEWQAASCGMGYEDYIRRYW